MQYELHIMKLIEHVHYAFPINRRYYKKETFHIYFRFGFCLFSSVCFVSVCVSSSKKNKSFSVAAFHSVLDYAV